MNPLDKQLDRLLKSAAAAPRKEPGLAEFPLEARVMGAWRGSARSDGNEFLVVWFRRAAICACMLALASVAWDIHGRFNRGGAESAVAESALGMGVEP